MNKKFKKKTQNHYKYFLKLAPVLFLVIGVAVGTNLIQKQTALKSDAKFLLGQTYSVAGLNGRSFYRTSYATEAAPLYARAAEVSQGIYDKSSNTTYLVYTDGIKNPSAPEIDRLSAIDPHIISYNHTLGKWNGPVQLATTNSTSDAHHYPQIIVDNNGYLHVFHSFHGAGEMMHFTSNKPRSIDSWTTTSVPGTKNNTYVAAFKDNQGEIYLFYRLSYNHFKDGKNTFYEPQGYVKSSDNGKTWSSQVILIDPGRPSKIDNEDAKKWTNLINDGGWNTVYAKDYHQVSSLNRLAFTFEINNRNKLHGNQYYAYFDFNNDRIYNLNGKGFGSKLVRNNYTSENCCTIYSTDYNDDQGSQNVVSQQIVFEGDYNKPSIYYTRFENGTNHIKKAIATGNSIKEYKWQHTDLTSTIGPVSKLLDAEYREQYGTDLYVKSFQGGTPPAGEDYQYPTKVFNSKLNWKSVSLFEDHKDWEVRGNGHFNLIPNPHPQIRATMIIPKYTSTIRSVYRNNLFYDTYPIGVHYVVGEQSLGTSLSAPPKEVVPPPSSNPKQ